MYMILNTNIVIVSPYCSTSNISALTNEQISF